MYSRNTSVCWRMVTSTCVFLLLWLPFAHAKGPKGEKPVYKAEVKAQSKKKKNESIYCTPSTSNMAACSYSGTSFPGDSAVDSVIRSRFLREGVPFQWDGGEISASSVIPGLAPDAIMEHQASNFYLSYRKILRATAYLDHFLCSDGDCSKMLDIFWHRNATDRIPYVLSRFSWIPGTRYAFPIWGFGKDTRSPECNLLYSETEKSKHFNLDAKIDANWQCHWEIPLGAANISTSPLVPDTQYAAKSFVGKLDGLFNISYGTFRTQGGGCVTLIIPVDAEMVKWGWTSSDGCEDPKGVYLFDSYFMLAYIDPTLLAASNWTGKAATGGAWARAASERSEEQLIANMEAWTESSDTDDWRYYGYWGRGMNCEGNTPSLRKEYDCYATDMETAGTDNFGNQTSNRTMLVIGGRPIWAVILTESWEDRNCSTFDSNLEDQFDGGLEGWVDLGEDIYRSTSGGVHPWCTPERVVSTNHRTPDSVPNVSFVGGAPPVNIYDCTHTAELLLQVAFKGAPLKDISELARPATSQCKQGGAILNIAGQDQTYPNVVEWAVNSSVKEARYLLQREAEKALSTADLVATDWGATSTFLLALLTTIAAILGAGDVFAAATKKLADYVPDYNKAWNLLVGFLVVATVSIAALAPPIEFVIGEYYSRENNPQSDEDTAPTVLWTFVKANGPNGDYTVATAVVVTFNSLARPFALPLGFTAIGLGAVGTIWTVVIVWKLLQEEHMMPSLCASLPPCCSLYSVFPCWEARVMRTYSRHETLPKEDPQLQADSLPT